jgi:hypothetical protein
MKLILKLEELALMFLFSFIYFEYCSGNWIMYLSLFLFQIFPFSSISLIKKWAQSYTIYSIIRQ